MVMEDMWSVPARNFHHRRQFGEMAGARKMVHEPWSMAKKLAEAVIRSVPFLVAAMLPWILTYVQPPESVLRMKEVMAEWCTPSLCFVFLVVGIMVATPGVLNGAQSRGGLHDRGDAYQRHVTVLQREALRMPDIFSVGESITPLSIPAPAPVPVPIRDFPAVRPPPAFYRDVRGLGKSASTPLPRFEDFTPAKISATQSLDRDSYFPRPREPVMSHTSSYQDPVMSNSNSFNERLASGARRSPAAAGAAATLVFERDYPNVSDASAAASMSTASVPAVQLEVPASTSPAPTSMRSFEGSGSPLPTTTTPTAHVIDHDLPASSLSSPTISYGDTVAAPAPSPRPTPAPTTTFVQEIPSVSTSRPPTPSTRASTSAPPTPPPPASPVVVVQEVVATLPSVVAVLQPASPAESSCGNDHPESPIPDEDLADSPPATPTASPPPLPPGSPPATPMDSLPPPPPPPLHSPRSSLNATVIAPVEVHLSPIRTRKSQRSTGSRTGSSSSSLRESSMGKPPSHRSLHHMGQQPMSVPSKGSTSAAPKHEGESSLGIKAAVPQLQSEHDSAPGEAMKERPFATGSGSVSGNAAEDTNLKPADDDVDQRVEAFLANFRQQMRLQRQESLLRQQRGEE